MLFSKERLRNYVRFMQFGVLRFDKRQHMRCPKVEENLHRCPNLLHRPARTVASDRVRRASRQVKCASRKRCPARTSHVLPENIGPIAGASAGPGTLAIYFFGKKSNCKQTCLIFNFKVIVWGKGKLVVTSFPFPHTPTLSKTSGNDKQNIS